MTVKAPMKDMVVILPGLLGSVLQKDGKDLWAVSGRSFWDVVTRSERAIQSLALDAEDDGTLDDLGDGIRATALMKDVHLIPGVVKLNGYTELTRMLTDCFQMTVGDIHHDPDDKAANLYHFPYDWRRDNRVHARQLKMLIDRRLTCWREHSGAPDAKVILLGHSMGGLVARYYLEVLGGWQDARALFSFGTPYRGSMNAVNFLANGYKQLFLDLTGVVRSLTSIYQLLPVYPVIKTGSDYVRITETDQIPHVNLARALNARAFHDEIYDAVQANQNNEAYRRQFTTVPIVGIRQPTLQSAELRDGKLTPSEVLPAVLQGQGDFLDGDGTVPKISAIPYELSTSFNNRFIAETHCALQNQVQVLQGLRAAIGMPQFAGAANVRTIPNTIGLAVDDLYLPNEPLTLEARVIAYPNISGLKAVVTPAFGEGATLMAAFEETRFSSAEASASQHWSLMIDSLPAGLYRVTVSAEGLPPQLLPPPVHSLFEVVSAQDLNA